MHYNTAETIDGSRYVRICNNEKERKRLSLDPILEELALGNNATTEKVIAIANSVLGRLVNIIHKHFPRVNDVDHAQLILAELRDGKEKKYKGDPKYDSLCYKDLSMLLTGEDFPKRIKRAKIAKTAGVTEDDIGTITQVAGKFIDIGLEEFMTDINKAFAKKRVTWSETLTTEFIFEEPKIDPIVAEFDQKVSEVIQKLESARKNQTKLVKKQWTAILQDRDVSQQGSWADAVNNENKKLKLSKKNSTSENEDTDKGSGDQQKDSSAQR